MRILITSGGTKIPIDPVRSITNHSTGRFGSDIAKAALQANMDVIYLTSFEGVSPFCKSFNYSSFNTKADYLKKEEDFSANSRHHLEEDILELKNLQEFSEKYHDHYIEYRYQHYNEYASCLKKIIEKYQPDAVILAAAVSDYIIENYSPVKIRSH
jgi:phosphopantothenoylcysteine synthetase/decarboxylase